ncbi:MAG TPA: FxsA family protein [Cellvibrionaceae bacterium]
MPFIVFLLLFISIPLVEIALFIEVGGEIGALPTVALVVLTAVVGVILLRWQGLVTLLRARERMAAGQMPAQEMLEGLLLAIGGVLLLVPGFFTDAVGFALLIPPVRRLIYRWLKLRMVVVSRRQQPQDDGHTFDGEYRRDDKDQDSLPPR